MEPADGVTIRVLRTTPLLIKSAEEQVYEALRDEILHGMEPGSPLRLAEIADRLGVSTMPVRAALMRLESDGLVRQQPRRGAIVAPLDVEDIEEIQSIRCGIEGLAARLGAAAIDPVGLERMGELMSVLESAAQRRDLDQYLHIATEFEDECYRAARRARLLGLVQGFRQAAQRYVRLAVGGSPDFKIDAHERLLEAARANDGAAAEAIIRESLLWTLARIVERMQAEDQVATPS